jgi:hypothetical protein
MRCLIPCMLALFLLAPTCGYAQLAQKISGTPYGEAVQSTMTQYALSQAMPIAKSLVGKKIVIVGTAQKLAILTKTPVWFWLTEGTVKCPIVNKLTTALPPDFIGKKVGVLGSFAINSLSNEMSFLATGITIVASSNTSEMESATKQPEMQTATKVTVYGAPIPSTAKVMTLATALPVVKQILGQMIVVTGAVSSGTAMVPAGVTPPWITLVDGTAKVPVRKKISVVVPALTGGQKISLYGTFGQNPTTSALEFTAISLRIP